MFTFRSSIAMALITVAAVHLTGQPAVADDETSTVKGKVTLKGEPLKKGRIFIHLDKDQFVGAKIKDGEYSIDKVPVGEWRVTVEGEGIAANYSDDRRTPLKIAVRKDSQAIDLALD